MRSKTARGVAALLVTLLVAGCAAGSGTSRGTGNVLTYEELMAIGEPDLYRAIERLRPRWLRPRGQTSVSSTTVVTLFVDGAPRGDVSQLRGMQVNTIQDITYLTASEAGFRFGTIAGSGGTISIRTNRGG